jgi:hypothetical protein
MATEQLHHLREPRPVVAAAPEPAQSEAEERAAGAQHARQPSPVVLSLELGWRLAVLYADLEHPLHEVGDVESVPACLPAVETMPNGDQLELQVRAAASLAFRLKADARGSEILALAGEVHAASGSRDGTLAIRQRLCACHGSLIKELWASQEGQGKAYELGTSLFDSWNRVRMAGRAGPRPTVDEWRAVFARQRTERIKVLLDDLQSQLPPTAVTVVKAHLDFWCDAVAAHLTAPAAAPPRNGLALLRTQTIIWRQLLTRDKEPEAFLQREQRRNVHREFTQLVWRSFLRPLPIATGLAGVAVLVGLVSGVIHVAPSSQGFVAFLGAIGLSQASLAVIARDRIRDWTGLLWNRALANVVFEATCLADLAFTWRRTSSPWSRWPRSPRAPTRPTPQL